MFLGVALMRFIVPVSINQQQSMALINKPYVVQAVIDSARIIGLPSSKAAKAYALKIQAQDPLLKQITFAPEPVSDRRLFFRNYFYNKNKIYISIKEN